MTPHRIDSEDTGAVAVAPARGGDSPRPGGGRPGGRPGALLAIVLTGQFMALLDVFIVNVAAPTVRTDLHASDAGLQLIIAGYTIAYAVLLISGARLGARIGHRRAFLYGLAVFTAASLACGLATGTGQLIAFRFVQGAGSALMLPQVLSLIQRTYTGPSRARALGAYAAVLSTGAAAGQILGGVLVSADLFGTGWRPVFLVNVPIGLLLMVLGARLLPRDARTGADRARGLDLPGLLLLAAAVSLVTVVLVLGQDMGWPLWCWVALAAGAALAAVFAAHQSRLARRGGAPLITPRVVRAPGVPAAMLRIVLSMAANAGLMFALTLHLQSGLGYGALRTGWTFVPAAAAFGLVGLNWQRLPERWRAVMVPGGFLLAAGSFLALGLLLGDGSGVGPASFAALAGIGSGLGLAYSPTLTGALATVRREDAADASGVLVTSAQLGLLAGVAVFGAVFLEQVSGPGAGPSADAFRVTCLALSGAALCGAFARQTRRHPR